MASTAPKYYRPYYPSDSEESDASADDSEAESQLPDYVSFAQGLFRAAGPPLSSGDAHMSYAVNAIDRHTAYGPFSEGQEGVEVVKTPLQIDNVIVLKSLDRDKSIYPQPTNCQLMLPRTYVNVSRFEIPEINFIPSFFYFRADKYNIAFLVKESERVTYSTDLINPQILSPEFNMKIQIREGTYNIDSILAEISTQLNTPPLFYDFINGFSDFYKKFTNAGDCSLNFNYPGDNYYDAGGRIYISNPTIDQIVSYYFQQRFMLPTAVSKSYTENQVKVAYYYPVLKELFLDTLYQETYNSKILYAGSPISPENKSQLLYFFKGLDDPIMSDIINNTENITVLDAYRLAHTFRFYPINQYICTYSTQTNYVCIQSTSLNTSLTSLINTTYNNLLNIQAQRVGYSISEYNDSSEQMAAYQSILSDMFDVLQSNFAYIFGISYGEFADTYYLTFSNSVLVKNGKYASNVNYTYNKRLSPRINSNILNDFIDPNNFYWPNMINIPAANQRFTNTIVDSNSPLNIYNIQTLSADLYNDFQDPSGNVYVNPLERSSDIVVRINPGTYTIIPLKSSVRQTAQIVTLPRPSIYLYPEWVAANYETIGNNQYVFDEPTYNFALPTGINSNGVGSNISYQLIPALSNIGTTVTLSNSPLELRQMTIQATPNGAYFTFTTPPHDPSSTIVYKYATTISIFPGTPIFSSQDPPEDGSPVREGEPEDISGNVFTESVSIFVYHDQAAFYADVGPVGKSNGESPFFYKYMKVIPAGSTAQSIYFTAFEDQQYYILFRATDLSSFGPVPYTIVPFISSNAPTPLYSDVDFDPRLPSFNPYELMHSNFYIAKVHDPDYIRLPIIDSNGYYYKTNQLSRNVGFLPSFPQSNSKPDPSIASINTLLLKPTIPLGYFSNVSDDLTDYIPVPFTFPPRGFDPTNTYMFRYSPDGPSYNTLTRTYNIRANPTSTGNVILNPDGTRFKGSNTTSIREKRIVQYTGTHYIFTESNAFTEDYNDLKQFNSTNIPGLNTPLEFVSDERGDRHVGPCGFLFMPEEGTWLIKRITILLQTSNTNVHFLAIYPTSYIYEISRKNASLSSAICICVQSSSRTYFSTTSASGVAYGTYYTYSNVYTVQSNYSISGRTQNSFNLITDTNSYYSAIAYSFSNPETMNKETFTMDDFSNSTIQTIENLTGTCIPYPDLGLYVSPEFYDGTPSPNSYSILLSSNLPLTVINETHYMNPSINPNFLYSNYYTSQYAQSSPIVNSHLHFLKAVATVKDFQIYTNYFLPWYSIPGIPTNITATIFGYVMFQTSIFPIVSYPLDTDSTTFTLIASISLDNVFDLAGGTIPLAQAGNSTSYIFVGSKDDNLIFAEYDVSTSSLYIHDPIRVPFDTINYKVQSLVVKGTQWWLCFIDTTGMYIASGENFTDPYLQMSIPYIGEFTSAELAIDPTSGLNVYFALSTTPEKTYSTIYSFPIARGIPVSNNLLDVNSFNVDPNTIHFSVQFLNDREYIYHIYSSNTFVYRTDTRNRSIVRSQQNLNAQPKKCVSGARNSLWILFNSEPYIRAFVFSVESINILWQQFFPVLKIELIVQDEKRLSTPDTNNIKTPEWGHVAAFGYSDIESLNKDIYSIRAAGVRPALFQWGKESSYQVADTSFQGYYFNAYLGNLPLQTSNTSYVALRGFSPTESFQTEVRISLPNVYDLGYVTFNDLINEIGTLSTHPAQFSAVYSEQLSTFDGSFVRSNADAIYGISSITLPTVGFSNFIVEYSSIYGQYIILKSTIDNINISLESNMNKFTNNDLQYILPKNHLTRTRITDSLTFSLLWKTGLKTTPPSYANLVDGWGLGWNLGFPKEDDVQPSKVHFAPSMFKISDDFIYLRLNPEFNLNRMSSGTKENYLDSREPSGLTSYYYCRMLLNGYGQAATTFVHAPIILEPRIPKISKISFQWLDAKGNVLNIASATDSDWHMTVNIQENIETASFVQTSNLNASDFLAARSTRYALPSPSPASEDETDAEAEAE